MRTILLIGLLMAFSGCRGSSEVIRSAGPQDEKVNAHGLDDDWLGQSLEWDKQRKSGQR